MVLDQKYFNDTRIILFILKLSDYITGSH